MCQVILLIVSFQPQVDMTNSMIEHLAIRRRHRETNRLESTHREDPALYGAGKRLFGSWTAALAVAGFPKPKQEYYTADEVKLLLIDHYEHELPLTCNSFNDPKLVRSAHKHFGGWRRAVESLGLGDELRRKWTKQSVVEAILHRRAAGFRLHTTYKEDRGLFYAAVKRFGNWHLALQAAGIKCRPPERWSEEKIVQRLSYYARTTTVTNIKQVDPNLVGPANDNPFLVNVELIELDEALQTLEQEDSQKLTLFQRAAKLIAIF